MVMQANDWRRQARRAATAAGVLAGGTLLTTVGLGAYVAHVLTAPKRPGPQDHFVMTPFETGADFEEVTFAPARGDHSIHGWWFPRPETNRVIIGCHGYRGSKSELIGIATAMWRAGFNVLLFDYHGHGADVGAPVTLGYREVQDFFGAVDYVAARVEQAAIGVIGFSMGASVAIMGSARRPEVRAVVADSPFASHAAVVAHNVERITHVSGRLIASVADVFIARSAGYRGSDVAPEREVAAIAPRPLLLIHGTADDTIPVAQVHRVYAAAGNPKELWLGEGAPHCGTYFLDRRAYCLRVASFFAQNLTPVLEPIETHDVDKLAG
ncbi:MAG: alpha/beta hydrolase [Ktedonobacterales bacterium]